MKKNNLLLRGLVYLWIGIFILSLPGFLDAKKATPQSVVYPGAQWEYFADPTQAGFSLRGLQEVVDYTRTLKTTGMVVVVDGKILMEYGNVTELSYLASARKSVLSMLYGKYVANGTIKLNKTLGELKIKYHSELTPQEQEATIEDLLNTSSGVYLPASNFSGVNEPLPERGSKKHGEYWFYNNWDFNVLGTIFEQETKQDIYDALEKDLAIPIQMQDFDRKAQEKSGDAEQSIHLAYHIWLSTRDMARLGYLMLRNGKWNDKQLIPEDWVKKSTSALTPMEKLNPAGANRGWFGYGYLWWVFTGPKAIGPYEGGYTAMGAYGQYIAVFPKVNMVIAHKTKPESGQVGGTGILTIIEKLFAARTPESQKKGK